MHVSVYFYKPGYLYTRLKGPIDTSIHAFACVFQKVPMCMNTYISIKLSIGK